MLLDGNENLAGHVSTLLCPWSLILDVNTGSALLNEELGELHGGGETTVAGVSVGNDGPHVINGGSRCEFCVRETSTSFALFPVVEELCGEQVLDFIWDGVIRIIWSCVRMRRFGLIWSG